ncbi:MAG: alpha-amylase [Lachnospiraceae bacterium]|nr:alpha-amylase [Lachnospiraceae bacterium]
MAKTTDKQLKNMMMYQIFVRNYSREGTFKEIEKDLDRIRSLGTDIVYLLPIHPTGEVRRKGTLGSPYAIKDYRAVNPEYGTIDDFKDLVSVIHNKGMKCIIDVVYNHTSPDSVLASEHPDWFYHKEDGSFGNRVGDWTDIIDLDYSNAELWDYQIETLKYWAGIVDGFRCDVAPLVPGAFWERARREVETVRPGCIWLAESVDPAFITELRARSVAVQSDCELFADFDICYDYDIYHDLKAYLCDRKPLSAYLDAVNRQEWIYPGNYIKLRFLENHDRSRIRFLVDDERAVRNLTAFSFFQKGMAFVYAGQEFGAVHLPSLFDRDTISLEPYNGMDMSEMISRLSKIRKNSIFTDSTYSVSEVAPDVCMAVHTNPDLRAYGIFSMKGRAAAVPVPLPGGMYTNEINGDSVEVHEGCISCTGEPIIILLEGENNL